VKVAIICHVPYATVYAEASIKIKDFTQAPLETFKSQISCPCLHIRCSICTFLGSLAPSPTNSVPKVSSLNFMEIVYGFAIVLCVLPVLPL